MNFVGDAMVIALAAHQGQVDKAGVDYIHHPLRVMELVRLMGGDEAMIAAAVLHDVVEDTPLTDLDVVDKFFERGHDPFLIKRTVKILNLLTKNKGNETEEEYLDRVLTDPDAALVKLADSIDNFARLALLDEATQLRLGQRYHNNLARLDPEGRFAKLFLHHRGLFENGPVVKVG